MPQCVILSEQTPKEELTCTSALPFPYLFLSVQSLPLCLLPQRNQKCGDKVSLAHMVLFVFCWHSYRHTVTNINF